MGSPHPTVDAGAMDAQPARDAATDSPPSSLWADGAYTLTRQQVAIVRPEPCGDGRPVSTFTYGSDANHACADGDWLYMESAGVIVRLDGAEATLERLTDYDRPRGRMACTSHGLVVGLGDSARRNAIIQFEDVTGPGQVRWSVQRAVARSPASVGGLSELAASDQLIAWTFSPADGPPSLYVSGPQGESPHSLPIPSERPAFALHADGARLVYASGGDIWLYTAPSGSLENLTADPADQWSPWISGDRVVWLDQRDTPSGTAWNLNNPEIYSMDLRTRIPTRITHDPPSQPVVQYGPVVAGDWIAWADLRHAAQPNSPTGVSTRAEIYGFNLRTGREYPLATGDAQMFEPAILNGRVLYTCSSGVPTAHSGLFIQPLPPIE